MGLLEHLKELKEDFCGDRHRVKGRANKMLDLLRPRLGCRMNLLLLSVILSDDLPVRYLVRFRLNGYDRLQSLFGIAQLGLLVDEVYLLNLVMVNHQQHHQMNRQTHLLLLPTPE